MEFSGSPKAGKTRCLSVLDLFLKRNGIKIEVYTERASIDVFILDRGIFDALVSASCRVLGPQTCQLRGSVPTPAYSLDL
jgi:hypothetical protein